jgi:breast cancer 2 susceptibility protein
VEPGNCLSQLKYRYEREAQGQRSLVRKICEHDDTASRFMVVCVASIEEEVSEANVSTNTPLNRQIAAQQQTRYKVQVTDGWYVLAARLDAVLCRAISRGRIREGTKLQVYGAQLVGCDNPKPPLEVGDSTYLSLNANSTRIARWDQPLGLMTLRSQIIPTKRIVSQKAPVLSLRAIDAAGGNIPCMELIVVRRFPLLFMETTTGNGETALLRIVRDEHEEAEAEARYQRQLSVAVEQRISAVAQEQAQETKSRRTSNRFHSNNFQQLTGGAELFEAMQAYGDSATFQQLLSPAQINLLHEYSDRKQLVKHEERLARAMEEVSEMLPSRQVRSYLKLRVIDRHRTASTATLTIWQPPPDAEHQFTEGTNFKACYSIYLVI